MLSKSIQRHNGRPLSDEQVAIAAVLAEAISNYSEDTFCAGWLSGIEHELWERILTREPDAYEHAVEKLYAAAGKERHDWGKPKSEFLAGLKILAERFQVWVYWQDGETGIHLEDWKPLHERWHENHLKQRRSLEEVWQHIHQPFPWRKSEELIEIPPMPKL